MKGLISLLVAFVSLVPVVAQAGNGESGLAGTSDTETFRWEFGPEYRRFGNDPVFGMRTAFEGLCDLDAPNAAAFRMEAGGAFFAGGLSVFTDLELTGDGRYASVASQGYLGGVWSRITRAGFVWKSGALSAQAGRLPHFDEVESPYSQFVNSSGHPSDQLDLRVDFGRFFYETRWLCLSVYQDAVPDRGAVYKVIGARFGPIAFGIQDASVFVRPGAFDAAYFLIPWPGFITQHVDTTSGAPWERDVNDNSIMGLFCEYDERDVYAYAQLLVDDINLNRFFNPDGRMIPDKLGFSLGGRWNAEFGAVGLHVGGATKYTYEAYGSSSIDRQYGYSYTYASSYELDGDEFPLLPEENAVGFMYGENSLAIRADYERDLPWFDLSASVEYVVNGERSPANPWHDYPKAPETTEFLSDDVLEHRVFATLRLSRDFGAFGGYLGIRVGWHANPTGLRPTLEGTSSVQPLPILSPESGGRPIFALTLGVKTALSMDAAR